MFFRSQTRSCPRSVPVAANLLLLDTERLVELPRTLDISSGLCFKSQAIPESRWIRIPPRLRRLTTSSPLEFQHVPTGASYWTDGSGKGALPRLRKANSSILKCYRLHSNVWPSVAIWV